MTKAITLSRWYRLIPVVFITYSLAYLDRANFGFGAAAGMANDLHITPAMSSLLAVDIVEIKRGRSEIDQRIGIVLTLQARRRVKRQIVIDELAEVRVPGRDHVLALIRLGLFGVSSRELKVFLGVSDHRTCERVEGLLTVTEHG